MHFQRHISVYQDNQWPPVSCGVCPSRPYFFSVALTCVACVPTVLNGMARKRSGNQAPKDLRLHSVQVQFSPTLSRCTDLIRSLSEIWPGFWNRLTHGWEFGHRHLSGTIRQSYWHPALCGINSYKDLVFVKSEQSMVPLSECQYKFILDCSQYVHLSGTLRVNYAVWQRRVTTKSVGKDY